MTTSFSALKSAGQKNLTALASELEKLAKPSYDNSDSDRHWNLTVDKAENGYAIIRFLPAPQGEDLPFRRLWSHGFKGPGGWYIENSLTTLGQDDPVSKWNTELWNSGIEANKKIVQGMGNDNPGSKRKLAYYSNIYVVKDPANPENEGKVFLFKYGAKLFAKINDLLHPQFPGEEAVNPFDFWAGANFQLKARKVEGYRNYDKSEFDKPAPLSNDDSELEAIWARQYSLAELVAPDKFKSYAELATRLARVLGNAAAPAGPTAPARSEPVAAAKTYAQTAPALDDDDEDYFSKLADED